MVSFSHKVIGAGRMASAMVGGILSSGLVPTKHIHVSDTNSAARLRLQRKYPHVEVSASNAEAVRGADVVVLAIKPQSVQAVLEGMAASIEPQAVLVSLVAGKSIEQLQQLTSPTQAIVRCMPNTPAVVNRSMTVWTTQAALLQLRPTLRHSVSHLLQTFGSELYVNDEALLDMATALSGTGPAYFFMIMEAMVDTGVHLGFSREMARTLVVHTMRGASELAIQLEDAHLATLRNDITSPAGTSAAALYEAERGNLRTVISDSIWAAYRRSLELGGKSSNVGPGRFKS